ncbi:telomere attrition and p53 response 1 protein [Anthonomus grandis grandis]|uniref:telomere attrition and p53 response 1 protein n=1 Tax=Anthonomus grandis grandis TaxID=2921223 RepID=UPI0021668F19|nr:telomere attrition and p53 response 1 protein [Anthonomus grandis grandis]
MNGENDNDTWLSSWEQQCAETIENQPDYDHSLAQENEHFQRKVWNSFQDSATAIAQLYRDRYAGEPGTMWFQFQTAAGTVTTLYKDSCESLKRTTELAKQSGHQKRNNELLNWAKRKRRLIRREDLLAFLSGRPLPTRQNHHHHHHNHHRLSPRPRNISPPPHHTARDSATPHLIDPNLHMFREALTNNSRRGSSPQMGTDLCTFISGEMMRHGAKRSASPNDVTMGSPTPQKRSRYM